MKEFYIIQENGQVVDFEDNLISIENLVVTLNEVTQKAVENANLLINKNEIIEEKQELLAAAVISVQTLHRQPCKPLEIISWWKDYVGNKENQFELMKIYDVVNSK